MRIFGLVFCCTLALAIASEENGNPVVESPVGSFRGTIMKSQSGRDIYTFRGIRYAEAPTGRNRFKQATLSECHDGVFDATEDGPICPQPNAGSHKTSEDCLRLNVYTAELPEESNQPNRSVIVFLHPGSFIRSSGSSYELGPQLGLNQDIVFVTINYRLGSLGFLSTGDHHAPGNAGLKDQVLALKWIQKNIGAFGGDPNRVTLCGHSAGGISATLHMVSPMSKGLFHRVLTIGGAATTQTKIPNNQKDLAKKQAELLGCPTDTLDNMFDCFYEKSSEEFVDSFAELESFSPYPLLVWLPVVEQPDSDDDHEAEPFLTGQPEVLITQGKAHFVPYYTGVNRDEFGYFAIHPEEAAQCGDNSLYDEFNDHWEEVAPKRFGYESGTSRSSHISKELKSFYFNDEPLKAGSWRQLANLYADALTIFQMHRFGRLMASYSSYPVYYYFADREICDTLVRWSNGTQFGVVHYDEIPLFFDVEGRAERCESDLKLANLVWRVFADFADTGNPTPKDRPDDFPVRWTPSTEDEPKYLVFHGDKKYMADGIIYQDRMDKWDELFPMASASSSECDD